LAFQVLAENEVAELIPCFLEELNCLEHLKYCRLTSCALLFFR
jgi:hypothetical protein